MSKSHRVVPTLPKDTGFNATTLTNSAQNSTAFNISGAKSITFFLDLVRTAATAVAVTFQVKPEGSTKFHTQQSISVAAGTGTSTNYTASNAVAGDEAWFWTLTDLDFAGDIRIQVTSTGATVDTLTLVVHTCYEA